MTDKTEEAIRLGKRATIIVQELEEMGVFKRMWDDAVYRMVRAYPDDLHIEQAKVVAIEQLKSTLLNFITNGKIAEKTLDS